MVLKAEILVGVPASGKTDYAKKKCKSGGWIDVNRDDIRFSLFSKNGWRDYKFTRGREKLVTQVQKSIITNARFSNLNVVISDTNLNETTRRELAAFLHSLDYSVKEIPFPVSLEEAYKRDAQRLNGVGEDVIYKMYQKWLGYTNRPVYTPNPSKPSAAIFDLDGTLADMSDIRSPYDWEKVGKDKVIKSVKDMLLGYKGQGYKIIICSGRDGQCLEESLRWLRRNEIPCDKIFMRAAGDSRKDTIIKEEIFWWDIAPNFNVEVVVDDRPCMIRLWYELKIPKVVSVGNPYIEF